MSLLHNEINEEKTNIPDFKGEVVCSTNESANDNMNVDSECFVLVISSHGEEVREHKPVDRWRQAISCPDGKVFVDDIFNILKESTTLEGKPKLLFLQICRYRNEDMDPYDNGYYIKRGTEHSKPGSISPVVQETNIAEMLHKAIYDCEVTSGCQNIYSVFESDSEEWNPAPLDDLATPTTEHSPSKDDDPTERTEDGTGSPDNHGADKSITGVDTYQNTCPGDFLFMYPVMYGKYAWRDDVHGSYMMQYMYKAENMSVLLKGGDILQYITKVCKSMSEFELIGFSIDDMQSMFFESIKQLCKEENRHILHVNGIPVNINKNVADSLVEKELNDYFQDTLPLREELKLMTDLIKHVHSNNNIIIYDNTLEDLFKKFYQLVESLSNVQNRDSVQQHLSSCYIRLPEYWKDHDLANCFKIICKFGEWKAILVQVYGDDHKDSTLEDLLNNFKYWVKSLSDVQNRDRVQQYLSNISLRGDWDDHDLANCFKIICKLGEMKAILQQLLPFKAACCVYHRLRETVTFSPKSERSKMARVLEELKRHDL